LLWIRRERLVLALVAVWNCPAVPQAVLTAVLLVAPLARAGALGLALRDRRLDAREQAASIHAEVRLTIRSDDDQPAVLGCLDPVLELARLAGEAVKVPTDERAELARLVVRHEAVVL